MTTDQGTLYRQLGRLIEAMPDLTQYPVSPEVHLWVARAYALVSEVGNLADPALFSITTHNLGTAGQQQAAHEITAMAYRAFAVAERMAAIGVGAMQREKTSTKCRLTHEFWI
jgi:hypothetical protein